VDVHVRRLRAKLGSEHESLIGTVRNVGYKAVRPTRGRAPSAGVVEDDPAVTDDLEDAFDGPDPFDEEFSASTGN
jgi:DNA-binding winged helix-turn-helix (wHTH) protein